MFLVACRPRAGIASSSFSAAVALTLPILGRLFDQHLYSAAFTLVSVLPIVGAAVWWQLPVRHLERATASAT